MMIMYTEYQMIVKCSRDVIIDLYKRVQSDIREKTRSPKSCPQNKNAYFTFGFDENKQNIADMGGLL